jgi:hypothetical protein
MVWKTNVKKTYLLPAAWRPARTSLLFSISRIGLSRTTVLFPRAHVGRPREQPWSRALSLVSLTGGTRLSAVLLLPHVMTEPKTNTTTTESIEETGISIHKRCVGGYKSVATFPPVPFSILTPNWST